MLKKLRAKITLTVLIIASVMLAIIFGTVFRFAMDNLEAQSRETLQTIARNSQSILVPEDRRSSVPLPYFIIERNFLGQFITYGGNFDVSNENLAILMLEVGFHENEQFGTISQQNLRYYRYRNGLNECVIFADISGEAETLRSLLKTCIILFCLSVLLFSGIGFLLSKWAVKPVEEAWNRQKQFISDASHELKTPLTVIMTNEELLREQNDPDLCRQYQDNIHTMTLQMRDLVTGLLDLSRIDNGSVKKEFRDIDFSELVESSVLQFEPLCFEAGKLIEQDLESAVHVFGSSLHLKQTIDILLDNAAKYANKETVIRVSLKTERPGKKAVLCVASIGNEIPKDKLTDIFKRFYRCDEARTMNRSYGLGLSIADSIISEHGGRIWAESGNGTNYFYIELPEK